jgi:hypothetical protein
MHRWKGLGECFPTPYQRPYESRSVSSGRAPKDRPGGEEEKSPLPTDTKEIDLAIAPFRNKKHSLCFLSYESPRNDS